MRYNCCMEHIKLNLRQTKSRMRETERGELMKYFIDRINPGRIRDGLPKLSMPRMGKILEQIPTKDLYYLKRICEDSANFSKRFFYELDPKKHLPESK